MNYKELIKQWDKDAKAGKTKLCREEYIVAQALAEDRKKIGKWLLEHGNCPGTMEYLAVKRKDADLLQQGKSPEEA